MAETKADKALNQAEQNFKLYLSVDRFGTPVIDAGGFNTSYLQIDITPSIRMYASDIKQKSKTGKTVDEITEDIIDLIVGMTGPERNRVLGFRKIDFRVNDKSEAYMRKEIINQMYGFKDLLEILRDFETIFDISLVNTKQNESAKKMASDLLQKRTANRADELKYDLLYDKLVI